MTTQVHTEMRATSKQSDTSVVRPSFLRGRSFRQSSTEIPAPAWLAQLNSTERPHLNHSTHEQTCVGHSFGRIAVNSPAPPMIQAKLTIGQPRDKYEQEADRVAEQVMRMPEPKVRSGDSVVGGNRLGTIQRACSKCDEEVRRQPVEEEEEGGTLRPKPLAGPNTPQIQRQIESSEGEEETLQSKLTSSEVPGISTGLQRRISALQGGGQPLPQSEGAARGGIIQRELITPLAPGGGFHGLMERDRRRTRSLASTPYHVCSRALQGLLGFANHAYIEAPPYRYSIMGPWCPAYVTDNPVTGTTTQKWDNSVDPCGQTPNCVPCHPVPGVTNVATCLRRAFSAYANLSLYRALGPNSNTFAGTLARSCCAGMVPKPPILGLVPGWNHSPAPARRGGAPCPPGPRC